MKKILIGCVFIIALSCKAQTIIPVERKINYITANKGIPDGIYFKDTNNLLDKYTGTWKGVYNNRNYSFYITKYTKNYLNVTEDQIEIRYLITEQNGTIVEDTRGIVGSNREFIIKGDYFGKNAVSYYMMYSGREYNCGQSGTLILHPGPNNQMSIVLSQKKLFGDFSDDCPLGRAVQIMPMDGMVVTKQ